MNSQIGIEFTYAKPVLWEGPAGIKIYSYGAMIALALGMCWVVFSSDLNRLKIKGIDASATNLFWIAGFYLGSKIHNMVSLIATGEKPLSDVMVNWAHYWNLESGHSFMGSAIGGTLVACTYTKFKGYEFLAMLDILVPLVPLGHAIGKWGCFLSGDGCYGPPAKNLSFAMSFPKGAIPTREFVHPTPLYESAFSGAIFLLMFLVFWLPAEGGKAYPCGRRAGICTFLYGLERMVIEPYRRHPPIEIFFGLTEYQALAVVLTIVGAAMALGGRYSKTWPRVFPPDMENSEGDAKLEGDTKKETKKKK